jgi:hypothetical protein
MKDDDIKIIEQMRDDLLLRCTDRTIHGRRADALTNLLAEVIETREMLANASKIRFTINDEDFTVAPDWDRDSSFWVEVDSYGNRIGKVVFASAREAYRASKEQV